MSPCKLVKEVSPLLICKEKKLFLKLSGNLFFAATVD